VLWTVFRKGCRCKHCNYDIISEANVDMKTTYKNPKVLASRFNFAKIINVGLFRL